MSEQVKVGVCGVGSLGQHHARIYAELPNTELVGVYDVDPARAKEIADQHGAGVFTSLDEMAGEVEAVSVVVPTDLHRDVSMTLLEQGLHLLVEKPIAETGRQAEEMVSLANEKNLMLQVGHVERFNPVLKTLEERMDRPRFIEAHRLASYPPPRPGQTPRGTEVGVVLDLMIHDLEVILHLVGSKVETIHAVGLSVLSPSEDIANVRLCFENKCVANVTASRVSPERMRKIRLFLEDAYVSLDYQNQAGEMYRMAHGAIQREEIPVEKGEPLANELRSFADCVKHHNEPVVTGEHAAEALKLAALITQQIKESSS
ncbi:MAG: Gfo/Idh/MocA family oxidoreductase [Verrucomicrobiota bacterium]